MRYLSPKLVVILVLALAPLAYAQQAAPPHVVGIVAQAMG